MSPRIAPGQLIEIQQGPAECLGTLKRGDVVLFHSDSSRVSLIKALRGLPGDKFSVSDGKIIINGAAATNGADEPYRLSPPRAAMIDLYVHDNHGVIPPDTFLVIGENRRLHRQQPLRPRRASGDYRQAVIIETGKFKRYSMNLALNGIIPRTYVYCGRMFRWRLQLEI